MARAQVEIIASALPATLWLNPSWAFVATIPVLGFFPMFGAVPAWQILTTVLMQVFNGILAGILYILYRRDPADADGWLRVLTGFQALVGMSWGATVWLLWVPDNAVNNVIVMMPIVALLWTYAASRTTHLAVYFAAVVPIFGCSMVRFATSPDGAGPALAFLFPIVFFYVLLIAMAGKRLTSTMLQARFANENLTSDLRTARDDALRKRYEAETANASKTTFLANMSHELRTPLNAVIGFSEIIAQETFGPVGVPRYRDYARDINASGSHLLSIINDILDVAKIESGKMTIEPVEMEPQVAIDQALRVLAPRVREKGQNLSVDIAPDVEAVLVDERAFKQIVINLVSNAVKFTPMGGTITVHGVRPAEGGFELIVEDDGPGIEPSLLDRIFTPFNQVDNRYSRNEGGTGLGLSLVRGLAVLHGGKAWIDADFRTGTKAHVYFPSGNVAARPARLTA